MVAFAAAIPWIASAVGSMLPAIVDSFRSGKSPEEAQQLIAPQRQAMIERLIGSGMQQSAAEAMADEAMKSEIEKAQLPEPMSPWLTAALAIGGGIGGYKLGAKLAGKMPAKGAVPSSDKTPEKIDTPAEQAVAKPAARPSQPDMVSPEELAPVQMQAEARSRMQPSALDIRNTRMLNNVPAPVRAPVAAPVATKPSGPFPLTGEEAAAAEALKRKQYYEKLATLDDGTQGLVDEMMPARRMPQGPFPEFLPGEMQSRTSAASLRPWESLPEVEGAMIRGELKKLKADPRGVLASMRSPFPDMESEAMRAQLYSRSGG